MRNLLGMLMILISASASEGFIHGKAIFSAAGSGMESRGRWAGTCRAPTCGSSHLSDGKAGRNPGCLDFKAVLRDGCFVDSNSFQFGRGRFRHPARWPALLPMPTWTMLQGCYKSCCNKSLNGPQLLFQRVFSPRCPSGNHPRCHFRAERCRAYTCRGPSWSRCSLRPQKVRQ
jgi:hypothetical protein